MTLEWKKKLPPLSTFFRIQIPIILSFIERAIVGDFFDVEVDSASRFETCLFCKSKKERVKTCQCSKILCDDCLEMIFVQYLPESKKIDNFKCIICLMKGIIQTLIK